MQINYYINGQEVNRPINYKELTIELNYDKDDNLNQATSLTEFEFGLGDQLDGNDAARLINAHLNSGLCFEGLPILIELENNGTTYQLFEGYLDTANALYDCDKIIIQGIEKKSVDWLNEVAQSKSYEYIYEVEGLINDSDFKNVPYVLSSLPDSGEALLAFISMAFIVESIVRQIKEISESTSGFTAFPIDAGEIVKLSFSILYTISLLVFAIMTIKQIINALIQPVKYHTCMSELKHAQKGAESFGYTFSSSILENEFKDSYILPEKFNQTEYEDEDELEEFNFDFFNFGLFGGNSPNSGNKQKVKRLGNTNKDLKGRGYWKGTVGDFFLFLKDKYNAKIIIEGNTLRLERRDFNNSAYNYIVPPVDQTDYRLNADELKSNYILSFATDINDKNTIQRYEGVSTQVITSPIGGRTDLTIIKGLRDIQLPVARATRKTELTGAEKVIKFYLNVIDAYVNFYILIANAVLLLVNIALAVIETFISILSALGLPLTEPNFSVPYIRWVNLSNTIDSRLNMLLMENDFVDVPKNLFLETSTDARETVISDLDEVRNNSLYLYNNYHFIESFISSDEKPNANQYKIFEKDGVPLCFDEYELVKNSNYIQDDLQRNGELLTLKWSVEQETASMTFKVNELYTNQLIETKITPDGK